MLSPVSSPESLDAIPPAKVIRNPALTHHQWAPGPNGLSQCQALLHSNSNEDIFLIFFEEFRLMQRSFYQIEWLLSIDFWNLPLKKVEFINCGNAFFFCQAPFMWSEWVCDSITNRLLSSTSDFNEILPPFTKIMTLLPIMGHVSSVSSVSSNSNKSFPRDPKNTYP